MCPDIWKGPHGHRSSLTQILVPEQQQWGMPILKVVYNMDFFYVELKIFSTFSSFQVEKWNLWNIFAASLNLSHNWKSLKVTFVRCTNCILTYHTVILQKQEKYRKKRVNRKQIGHFRIGAINLIFFRWFWQTGAINLRVTTALDCIRASFRSESSQRRHITSSRKVRERIEF